MDDASVVFSLGYVESWIEKAVQAQPLLENGDTALGHLKILEDALVELRRNRNTVKAIIQNVKGQIDAANVL